MKKAIVTGASGFIGTALCRELAAQGSDVIAVVKDPGAASQKLGGILGLRTVCCDISEFRNLPDYISDRDIDALYHLAWIGSAGSLRGDSDTQIRNIQYTCDTVNACARMNCKRMVFASSIMEYEVQALMATEAAPDKSALYSSAKIAADYMGRIAAGTLGIEYIRAVISNVYGPGETSPRLVNTSLRKLLSGEHCSFSAGEQMYDFIYIDDAAKAFAAIGKKGKANRTYYIGSQSPRPLKEFLCEMKNQIDPAIEIGLGELPFKGASLTYNEFDINALKNDTGFEASIDFAQGIRKTIAWIKEIG